MSFHSIGYYTMVKSKDKEFVFGVRLQIVRDALEKGIKPTARFYKMSKNTVRKWVRRYNKFGTKGMIEMSRAPHHIPHKTPKEIEKMVLAHRETKPGWGAKRLKREFDIPCSHGAISRILKKHGKIKQRRRKRKKRNDLREIKAKFRLFERCCIDTKYLCDIPVYWPQMEVLGLPKYQYTFRDMKSGAMFLGYSTELSLNHATIFGEIIGNWLLKHGVKTEGTVWQTDGGSEFIGSWNTKDKSVFIKRIESIGIKHFQIPKVTYNADVEAVHNTIELEFFDIEAFNDKKNFFDKVSTYNIYYNLVRKNTYKYNKSPLEILLESSEDIKPEVLTLPALDLDKLFQIKFNHSPPVEGHDVPGLSLAFQKIS